jgi:hypothetical protein
LEKIIIKLYDEGLIDLSKPLKDGTEFLNSFSVNNTISFLNTCIKIGGYEQLTRPNNDKPVFIKYLKPV